MVRQAVFARLQADAKADDDRHPEQEDSAASQWCVSQTRDDRPHGASRLD
jgi:hypothetical protein